MTFPQIASDRNKLISLFKDYFKTEPALIVPLGGGGSTRRYYRITIPDNIKGISPVIGVASDELRDNKAFIALDEMFLRNGIQVPSVYAYDLEKGVYLQQDLGTEDLLSYIKRGEGDELLKKSIEELVNIQSIPEKEWADKVEYGGFNIRQIMWDLNYFKYEFLKISNIEYNENALEDDFDAFANTLMALCEKCTGLMYRDCQSRNIMVYEGLPYWIDFQGARRGPIIYDIVSLLWQAKAALSDEVKDRMFEIYSDICENRGLATKRILKDAYLPFVLFRTLQVLGAYGFRGLVEGKTHFIESIPGAIDNLDKLLKRGVSDNYPELKRISLALINKYKGEKSDSNVNIGISSVNDESQNPDEDKLTVTIQSFSYKKGYPKDTSGNGGGFIFDCRWMANPGRYAEYKAYTGLDDCVITFLREHKECDEFIDKAYDIVIKAVRRYVERGFTSLQIGFGCTGGQHRSVYCAEGLAHKIAEDNPDVRVRLIHREQNIDRIL